MQAVQGQHGPPRPINHEAPGAKRKRRRFTRRPGSSLRCFCSVEALLPTCCRPWSCRPEWPTRPCRARPRRARWASRPALLRRCQCAGIVGRLVHRATAAGSVALVVFFGGRESARVQAVAFTFGTRAGHVVGARVILDDGDVALGAGGVLGEVPRSCPARRRGRWSKELASVSLRSPSIRVLGESVEALAALAVILSLRAYGPRGNVWVGEGFLPVRSTNFDLGFCFC